MTELLAWAGGPAAAAVQAAPVEASSSLAGRARYARGGRTSRAGTCRAGAAADATPDNCDCARNGEARAAQGPALEAAFLACRDARRGRDSRGGLVGNSLTQIALRSGSASTSTSERVTVTDPRHRAGVQGMVQAPVSAALPTTPRPSDVTRSSSSLHEVIPEVSRGAHRTIRGHIKVWVRVIVDPGGSVIAATLDRTGSSRYFQRLALEAAKKWTFPPTDTPSRRLMQVRFDFSRDGTTGRAVTL